MKTENRLKPNLQLVKPNHGYFHRGYPAKNLTPDKLSGILREMDSGYCRTVMELFDEMEEKDLHLATVMQTRVSAAASVERVIVAGDDSEQGKRIADFVRDVWNSFAGKSRLLQDLLSAIGRGFSMAEVIYEVSGGNMVATGAKFCPQAMFTFLDVEEPNQLLEFPNYLPFGSGKSVSLPRDKFIFHTNRSSSGGPLRSALYRGLSWYYLFTNYTIKDWMSFMELYGQPLRLGKFKATADEQSRAVLKDAVQNLGADAAAVISEDTTIEFIESRLSGNHDLFLNAIEFFDRQKSKRVLGQTLTTEQGRTGSNALGNVHERVRQDLLRFDCNSLDETLTKDLLLPLIKANFGEQKRYPFFKSELSKGKERESQFDMAMKIYNIGLPVSASGLYRAAGMKEPSEGEKLLKKGEKNSGI